MTNKVDLKEKMETLQQQYKQVIETLTNGEIARRKLEGAMEMTQALMQESEASENSEVPKKESKKVAKAQV
tara:strand:+ start:250 stop:462 length:213 start_codon:yes stop_codon:yes gene_type:complete